MKSKILVIALMSLLFITAVFAQEYDGYIFKTTEEIPILFGISSSVEPLEAIPNVYCAKSIEDIYKFADAQYIEYIEPNYTARLFGKPNDTYYSYQWMPALLGLESVWDTYTDLNEVRIGVIDSGVDSDHEDLDYVNTILRGYNTIANNTNTEDDVGHGTFLTGLISASRNNGKGLAGIASNVKIIPLKAFNSDSGTAQDICEAIRLAVDEYDCDIINMSFGFTHSFKLLDDTIEYARQNGVIMFAAVGNDGVSSVQYPAGYDCVIGVGSTTEQDEVAYYSQFNNSVFVTSPGYILSGLGIQPCDNENWYPYYGTYYTYNAGTSFSTPIVAAIAAIAMGIDPTLNTERFKKLIAETSVDKGDPGYDVYYGHGRIDPPMLLHRLTNPYISFPREITVNSSCGTPVTQGEIPAGTKLVITWQAEDITVYVNGVQIADGHELTVGYEDINITLLHKPLALQKNDEGPVLSGYSHIAANDQSITIIIAVYDAENQMTSITCQTAKSNSLGYVYLPSTVLPSGYSCNVFFFSDLKNGITTNELTVKSFNLS
ncbi:MAG: hypothetical protein E7588_07740 [Ruminococcaceae bacterium]|nr:hypothetical protein [Oscillospiraceae bacterium]